jgi:hypothetical protein
MEADIVLRQGETDLGSDCKPVIYRKGFYDPSSAVNAKYRSKSRKRQKENGNTRNLISAAFGGHDDAAELGSRF